MTVLNQFFKLLKTATRGDEIVLSYKDAQGLKKALEIYLTRRPVRAAGPAPEKKKARPVPIKKKEKPVDDPFKDIQIDENPELDEKLYETVYGPKKKNYRRGPVKQAGKRDKMTRIIADMIVHINDMIKRGDMSLQEYLNDPDVYLDRRIMGNYIKAPIMKKAIERHFKRMEGI